MITSPNDNYPQLCSELGLSCESCTSETGRQLARVCKGLRGKMIGQLFVQIHPHPACSKMHAHFAASYLAHSTNVAEMVPAPAAIAAVA